MAISILMFLFQLRGANALEFKDLKAGMTVQVAQNFSVNRLHSDGNLLCFESGKGIFPKVTLGAQPGADVPVRYFTVTAMTKDMAGYEVSLRSEQMPCSCIFSLEQRPEYFGGAGSNFKMLNPATPEEMAQVPAIESSCKNVPQWVQKIDMFQDTWPL
jgi:hypothetical protein